MVDSPMRPFSLGTTASAVPAGAEVKLRARDSHSAVDELSAGRLHAYVRGTFAVLLGQRSLEGVENG